MINWLQIATQELLDRMEFGCRRARTHNSTEMRQWCLRWVGRLVVYLYIIQSGGEHCDCGARVSVTQRVGGT